LSCEIRRIAALSRFTTYAAACSDLIFSGLHIGFSPLDDSISLRVADSACWHRGDAEARFHTCYIVQVSGQAPGSGAPGDALSEILVEISARATVRSLSHADLSRDFRKQAERSSEGCVKHVDGALIQAVPVGELLVMAQDRLSMSAA